MKSNNVLKIIILCSILAFSAGITTAAEAEKSPNFAMGISGNVNIGSQPAPVNTIIDARVAGTSVGSTVVQNAGLYGDKPNNKLAISAADGANVDVYVNNVKAGSIIYKSQDAGKIIPLNLDAPTSGGTGSSGSGTGTGSSSVSKAGVTPKATAIQPQTTTTKESIPGTTAKEQGTTPADVPQGLNNTMIFGVVGILALSALVIYALKRDKT